MTAWVWMSRSLSLSSEALKLRRQPTGLCGGPFATGPEGGYSIMGFGGTPWTCDALSFCPGCLANGSGNIENIIPDSPGPTGMAIVPKTYLYPAVPPTCALATPNNNAAPGTPVCLTFSCFAACPSYTCNGTSNHTYEIDSYHEVHGTDGKTYTGNTYSQYDVPCG